MARGAAATSTVAPFEAKTGVLFVRRRGSAQVVAAAGDGAVVRVLERLDLQIECLGTGTDVCDARALTIALPGSRLKCLPTGHSRRAEKAAS